MKRQQLIARLAQPGQYDLAIIGGGATGLGVALDAAARGLRVVLVESHDFAKGTSSRATKLLHGGVRYLAQGNIALVREALHERTTLLHNAPHLAQPLPFVMPSYKRWETPFYGIGLKIYDALAGKAGLGATEFLSREQTLRCLPTVQPQGLKGGVKYWDGQFDDARLALALARTAAAHGALLVNYCAATGLLHEGGKVVGLSKLARVVEVVSKRPQVQERMTETIADLLVDELDAKGVAVVIEATHTCMTIRGVRKPAPELELDLLQSRTVLAGHLGGVACGANTGGIGGRTVGDQELNRLVSRRVAGAFGVEIVEEPPRDLAPGRAHTGNARVVVFTRNDEEKLGKRQIDAEMVAARREAVSICHSGARIGWCRGPLHAQPCRRTQRCAVPGIGHQVSLGSSCDTWCRLTRRRTAGWRGQARPRRGSA
jgi:hypothetical protein